MTVSREIDQFEQLLALCRAGPLTAEARGDAAREAFQIASPEAVVRLLDAALLVCEGWRDASTEALADMAWSPAAREPADDLAVTVSLALHEARDWQRAMEAGDYDEAELRP